MTSKTEASEIRIIRVYDAPLTAVWDAWVLPEQVSQWWGPRGFTLTTRHKAVHSGGAWDYTMHGPDGTNYENKTLFLEVDPKVRMVYDHGGNDDQPPLFRVTVLFSESAGKTTMDMRMVLPSPEAAAETRKYVKAASGESTWDRLGEYLAKQLHGHECFSHSRSFDAPIETLYQLWTEPRLSAKWLAPTGATMEFLREGVAQGKSSFYFMSSAGGGPKMYGRASYLELERPTRLVYTQQFCDAQENVTRHPMAPNWPETMLTTVSFADEGSGRTRVTIGWEPHGNVTPAELETFVGARTGMAQGWTGSLDKLEELLATHDPIISTPSIGSSPSGAVAFIHLQIAKHEIQSAMGPGIQEVFAAVKDQQLEVNGAWFTVHHQMTDDGWDFDICVPLKSRVTPTGRVQHKVLEASPAATCSYFGGYEGLYRAWPALRAWIQAAGHEQAASLCEVYEIGPESGLPSSQWKTQLYQPLQR